MENTSSVWDDATASSSSQCADHQTMYLANIRDLALKVVYIVIGTVGVIDNLFVLFVFFCFINVADKVSQVNY